MPKDKDGVYTETLIIKIVEVNRPQLIENLILDFKEKEFLINFVGAINTIIFKVKFLPDSK